MAVTVAELMVIVRADTKQAETGLSALDKRIRGVAAGGMLLGAGTSMLGFVKNLITAGAEFEAQLILVDQLAGGTGNRLEELKTLAFELDQQMIFGSREVIDAMEQLAREGFTHTQMLEGNTEAALNFAAAVKEDVSQAANFYGIAARVFQDEGLSAAEIADSLTAAVLRSGRPLAEMATGFQYVGGAAAMLGVPLEDTVTALAFLGAQGIKVRSAGTGLRTMFLELADTGVQEYLASLGVTVKDLEGNFVGIPSIIEQLGGLMEGMTEFEGLAFLEGIFGKPAASPLLALIQGGTEAWEEFVAKMETVPPAADIMEARMDSVAGSIDRMAATWLNLKRIMGDAAGVVFRPLIDGFTGILDSLQNAPPFVLGAIAVLTALTGALFTLGGAITLFQALGGWSLVGAGLAALLSPAVLLTLAVAGLALAFRGPLGSALGEVSDRLGEFGSDIAAVYERLREGGAGSVSAAVRAFGSALEDLTGIEMSGFFFELGNSAEAARDRLVELRDAIASGDWDAALETLGDLGTIVIGASVSLGGELKEMADGFKGWLAQKLGLPTVGGGEGFGVGFDGSEGASTELSMGTVLLAASAELWGEIKEVGTNLKHWLAEQLGIDTPGRYSGPENRGSSGIEVPLGTVLFEAAAELGGQLKTIAGNFGGWLKSKFITNGLAVKLGNILVEATLALGTELLVRITQFRLWIAQQILGAAGKVVVQLPEIAVNILRWARGDWPDVVQWLKDRLTAANVAVTFDNWTLNIKAPSGGALTFDASPVVNAIKNGIQAAVTAMADFGDFIWKAVQGRINGISLTGFDLFEFGTKAGGAVREAMISGFSALVGGLAPVAQAIGSALVDAIAATPEAVANAGTAVAEAFLDLSWSDIFTVIAFPAKVFAGITTALAGFTLGVILGEDKANEFATKLKDTLVGAVAVLDWAHGPGGGIFSKIYDDLLEKAGNIDWGGVPGAFVSSLKDAIIAALGSTAGFGAEIWDAAVAAVLGGGGENLPEPIEGGTEGATPVFPGRGGGTESRFKSGGMLGKNAAEALGFGAPFKSVFEAARKVVQTETLAIATAVLNAATQITNATLAIEARITAMAQVVTVMAFNAGDGFNSGLSFGVQQGAALLTNATLAMEARLMGFAGTTTVMAFNAGDGFNAGVSQGMQRGGSIVTTATLAMQSRLTGFANHATVMAFNAGDGWFAGIRQGLDRALGAAQNHVGSIQSILSINLYSRGFQVGSSYSSGVANGLAANLDSVQANANAIANAAAGAQANLNATASAFNKARQLANGTL